MCKICQTNLKYAMGSISSMTKHLDCKHGIEVSNCKNADSKSSQTSIAGSSSKTAASGTKSVTSSGQLRLHEAFSMTKKCTHTSTKHVSIARAIGVFIAKDMRPFSIVENRGFVNMVLEC